MNRAEDRFECARKEILRCLFYSYLADFPNKKRWKPTIARPITRIGFNRFAIGLIIGVARLSLPPFANGLIFGLLISLSIPHSLISKGFTSVVGIGMIGGLIISLAIQKWSA